MEKTNVCTGCMGHTLTLGFYRTIATSDKSKEKWFEAVAKHMNSSFSQYCAHVCMCSNLCLDRGTNKVGGKVIRDAWQFYHGGYPAQCL